MQPNSSQQAEKESGNKKGSHKNIWYGTGRHRIEIPKTVLKSRVLSNDLIKSLHIRSTGYYPKAKDHYTYRRKGLPENFLFYCVDGHGWYQVKGKRYEVGPNECFILPPNTEHAYGSSEDNPWSIYWVHFGGEALNEFNNMQAVQKLFEPNYIKNNGDILPLFNKIYQSLELGYSLDNLVYANMGLVQFINLFIYNTRHYEATLTDKSDCIDNAILYMQQRINDKISLTDLGKQYNYSVSRFSNLFKQKTGYAPIDYFVQLKMQKACQQLDFTDRSIKNIAMSMGFNDPYYFSRRFRAVIGMSPKKYRQLNNEQHKSPA
ncbi:AraC family transcriptional regulator [Chitinophaga sp. Cy-1792]|uniref:AraC family transcriptional regulator n=1 Tax=Chitinophaga sp. Cy-1792 TaxID=2608339 RepID=UPI0014234828|nr:AraC family transcriptional regulator [Chitinophaga sp. Cy-1792]NIG55354.1 AraC family transcriptional regulator [Chitinophaga sp. Cy-1792]